MQSNDESSDLPTVTRLGGRRFGLRHVVDGDLPFLYSLATADAIMPRWRYHGILPTADQFVHEFWNDVLVQFLAYKVAEEKSVGFVTSYAHDVQNRVAHIAIVLEEACWKTTAAGEILHLFLRYLFRVYNLRKVYAEVPEYNYESIASGAGNLFEREATLHGTLYVVGKYWDVNILTVDRDHWLENAAIFDRFVDQQVSPRR